MACRTVHEQVVVDALRSKKNSSALLVHAYIYTEVDKRLSDTRFFYDQRLFSAQPQCCLTFS